MDSSRGGSRQVIVVMLTWVVVVVVVLLLLLPALSLYLSLALFLSAAAGSIPTMSNTKLP